MIEFHPVAAADGQWAQPLLWQSGHASCEFSFVNLFMWSHVYHTQIARFENWVVARSESENAYHYLYPAGSGDERAALEAILQDARDAGRKLVIYSVPPDAAPRMGAWFPGLFRFEDVRDDYDYIYDARELAELPGRKFQKKRNLCSRFERDNPDWQFRPLTPDVLPAVRRFNNEWCQLYDNRDDAGIAAEHRAIELVFQHYGELGLKGGYITAGGRIVAFSFGSALNAKVFDTHVEKALYDVTGAYNIINREMARAFCGGCQWINREDDVGEEGLRKAKLSYNPVRLEPKWLATRNDEE